MTVDDLVTWLRAQLDDDERVAQRAASLCGCHPPSPRWLFGDESTDGRILVADDPHPDIPRRLNRRWNRSYDGLFAAGHIALHDPARELAEVDAKRQRLDLIAELATRDPETALRLAKLDALPYADRPGYRFEWAPA